MAGLHLGVGLYVDLKKKVWLLRLCNRIFTDQNFILLSKILKSLITIYFATVATLSTSYAVNSDLLMFFFLK